MMPPQQFRKPRVVRHYENVLNWWQIPGEINQDICGCEIQLRPDEYLAQTKQSSGVMGPFGVRTEDELWSSQERSNPNTQINRRLCSRSSQRPSVIA